jgi:hypothetical protein
MIKTLILCPDPGCSLCGGTGTFIQDHPDGSTTSEERGLCDCVTKDIAKDAAKMVERRDYYIEDED